MNHRMWTHPATQANVRILLERKVELIGPEDGELAEGESGVGRMSEPEEIFQLCATLLAPPELTGKKVLVSAGGTREPLDAVRFVGNRSSGRMGVALAEEARRRGGDVVLLSANLAVAAPFGVQVVDTPTADSMRDAALAHADADLVLMAAAVADYKPTEAVPHKRPKAAENWSIQLEPTRDIVRELAARRENGQIIVAFGAEQGEAGLERKRAMLTDKDVDLVVYNDIARTDIGFDSKDNEVVLITRDGEKRIARAPKPRIAAAVLDEAVALLRNGR
jgi:phosphopantothenoylcysteine decarboxylase/phosphopantothenate--cysteine ligase